MSAHPPTRRPEIGPTVAIVVIWAAIQILFIKVGVVSVLDGNLADSDAYSQLLNVSHFMHGGAWYDGLLPRSNWPFGEPPTWSHALDIMLLAMAGILRPFMAFEPALFWSGVAASPLLGLACAFGARWMARPLLGEKAWIAALLLLLQPGFLGYTDARGPNHHGLMFLCFIFTLGFMLRSLLKPNDRNAAIGAGVAIGAGLWVSLEMIVPLVLALALLGLLWLFQGQRWAAANRGLAIGFLVATVILLPVERAPVWGLLTVSYDRLSIVHVVLGILLVAFWSAAPAIALRRNQGILARSLTASGGVALACLVMFALFPQFFAGPLAAADPQMVKMIITKNTDWQSTVPWSRLAAGRFFFYWGTCLVAIPWLLRMVWQERGSERGAAWCFIALVLLFFAGMTLWALRFAAFAEIPAVLVLADLIVFLRSRLVMRAELLGVVVRSLVISILIIGPSYAGMYLLASGPASAQAAAGECDLSKIAPVLDDPAGLGSRQHVIAAGIHSGPEIMYRTPHAVLATPMIHNEGILAVYRMMSAGDDAAAKAVIDARQVDLILLCPASGERDIFDSDNKQDTFYNRLLAGHLPPWLKPVPLQGDLTNHFYLFSVSRDAS